MNPLLLADATLDDIRAWLDAANRSYQAEQAATIADHERIAELVREAVEQARQMTDEQLTELFQQHLPTEPIPDDMAQRLQERILNEVQALASGRVDPVTREIVITPAKDQP